MGPTTRTISSPAAPDWELPPEVIPDLDTLITEDGKAADNIQVE